MACTIQLCNFWVPRASPPFFPKLFPVNYDPWSCSRLLSRHAFVSLRVVACHQNTSTFSSSSGKNKDGIPPNNAGENVKGDALAEVFRQLEKDLERGYLSDEGNEVTEEDIKKFSQELEGELAAQESCNEKAHDDEIAHSDFVGDLVESVEEVCSKLKNWQLRRLAAALKIHRRRVSVKRLAADVCLDRCVVLDLLREPPPKLLMLSELLPDKPEAPQAVPQGTHLDEIPPVKTPKKSSLKDRVDGKTPIHVLQKKWSTVKGLKKIQVQALEKIFKNTKRPNDDLVNNIVHVLRAPRGKVIKWFMEKRAADKAAYEHRGSLFRTDHDVLKNV